MKSEEKTVKWPPLTNRGAKNSQDTVSALEPQGIESTFTPLMKNRVLIDKLSVSVSPVLKGLPGVLAPDEFVKDFFDRFNKYLNCDVNDFNEFGGGQFYNYGMTWSINGTVGRIQIKYFDPKRIDPDKDFDPQTKYLNQKINIYLSGNGCQALREMGTLYKFMCELDKVYTTHATEMDLTIDLFNPKVDGELITPSTFRDLYDNNFYIGHSGIYSIQEVKKEPTVYIGRQHGARTIMIYDKFQENTDKDNIDEPELYNAVRDTNGSWLRIEQHFKNSDRADEAHQVYMMLIADGADGVQKHVSEVLYSMIKSKCRFTGKPVSKKNKHKELIPTNKKWDYILNSISENPTDYAFIKKVKTLADRMYSYKIGRSNANPGKLFKEIIDEYGTEYYQNWMKEVADFWSDFEN